MDLRYQYVFDAIPLGVVLQDSDGSITAANPAAVKILGLSLDQLQGRTSFDPRWRSIHADGSAFPGQDHPAMVTLTTGQPVRDVVMGVINPQTGEYTWININAVPLPSQSGQPPYPVMATFEDITARIQADQRVRLLTRLYVTISQINQAIVRAKTREDLFEAVCKVAVSFGEFRLACIGMYDSTSGVVTPVSVSVPGGPLPQPMGVINAHLDPFKESMIGTALVTGEIACQADIPNDLHLPFLHAVARTFGYQSAAAVPLRLNQHVVGVLILAAAERDFFNSKQEIKLLEEIGLDISFAMDAIAASEKLEAAHRQTSEILESISDAFYSLDREERFSYVNQRTAQLWNKQPDELVGRRLTDIFPNAEKAEAFRRIRQALVAQRRDHIESYSTLLNQWVETHIYPTENGVSVYFQDITARKQAEIAVQASETQFRTFMDASPTIAWIKDEQGRHVYLNQTYENRFHVRLDDWYGKTDFDVWPDEVARGFRDNDLQILTDGQPKEFQEKTLEADGKHCYWQNFKFPIRDMEGKRYVAGLGVDITAFKLAEEKLRESEERYRLIAENTGDVTWVLDLQSSKYTYVSPSVARLRGYSVEEVLAQEMSDTITPASIQYLAQVLPPRLEEYAQGIAKTYIDEIEQTRKDGSRVWTETSSRFVVNPTNNRLEVYGVSRDITERKQAQEQLQKMTDLLLNGQEIAHLGSFEYDAATGRTVWSEEEFRIYGYDPAQRSPDYDIMLASSIHPEDAPLLDQTFLAAMQNGTVYELEHRIVRPDGSVRWVYDRANPYFNQAGQLTRYIGVTLDITERRQALDALKESVSRYRELADSIQDGFLGLDQDWRFTYINQRAASNVGRKPEDLLGKIIWEAFPQILGTEHEQLYRQVMAQRQPLSFELAGALTSQWYSIKVYPSVQGISVFWIDITEQKRAEEVLRKSEQKFTTLFDQSAVPLMLTRWSDHVFINVNEAWVRMFGYTREEVYGKTSRELGINRSESLRQHARDAVGQDKPLRNLEVQVYTKFGDVRTVLTNINRIEIENESYVITSVQDITELKHAEEDLRRSNAELEQFAYVASHDLQEPLRTVAGMVTLLQQRYQGQLDARADEYIHHAVDASNRMEKLINDLLDFSRVDRKGHPFELTQIEQVVKAALANLQTAIAESQANITYNSMPLVRADGGQLVQVFQNLIGNAIKFRSERPLEILIGAEEIEDGWRFAVQDNGIGIDPQYFERVFLLFQRLHTRRKYPGTGIGLALCKKIIERHGGKIWIESIPNQGAIFYFTLPER